MKRIKPKVVISRCLGFEACRYNGQMFDEEFIRRMRDHIEFITVCPEMDIGMKVPRESIRLINQMGKRMLLEQKTGKDYLNEMESYIRKQFSTFDEVDGFILKSKSPSCAIKDARIYESINKSSGSKKGSGVFGDVILQRYDGLPIEDDGRLKNFKIREHFLTKLFTLSDFKEVKKKSSFEELIEFHKKNIMLFNSHNQKELRALNKLLKEYTPKNFYELLYNYEKHLSLLLARSQRRISNKGILLNMLDSFSERISQKEYTFILRAIDRYVEKELPLAVPNYLIKLNLIRFNEVDLLKQTYFAPYPEELIELGDSGKGRDF